MQSKRTTHTDRKAEWQERRLSYTVSITRHARPEVPATYSKFVLLL